MKSNSSATSRAPAGPCPCPCPCFSVRHQPPSTLLCQPYMCTLRLSHAPLPPLALHRTASHCIASHHSVGHLQLPFVWCGIKMLIACKHKGNCRCRKYSYAHMHARISFSILFGGVCVIICTQTNKWQSPLLIRYLSTPVNAVLTELLPLPMPLQPEAFKDLAFSSTTPTVLPLIASCR